MPQEVTPSRRRPRAAWGLLFALLFSLFVAGGIYYGVVFLSNLATILGGFGQGLVDLPIGVATPPENAPDWRQKERVNILLLGVDRREDEGDVPSRTDTMMIITIDPYSKTGGMLGLPRDLWVAIPISDNMVIRSRINEANVYGDLYRYPGGGPALAKKTVQYNLGVKIHYYALMDFEGFRRIVDALGGITVDVKTPLVDYAYPTPDYGTMRIYIPAGLQHMDGERALQYARSRHMDSDIGRLKRQQELLLALRQRALQLDLLPKLPQLIKEFKDSVKTDLSVSDMMTLAMIAKDIDRERIVGRSIDHDYAIPTTTPLGAEVLVPQPAEIGKLVREVFFDARQREEAARIEVLNGTTRPGLAARTAALLENYGWAGVTYGNAEDGREHRKTTIIDYAGKHYSSKLIAGLLQIPLDRIESKPVEEAEVDIRIILGEDAKLPPD